MINFEHPVIDGTKGNINARELFPEPWRPLKVEIGFGNGDFIFGKVQTEEDINFLAIEFYHRGIQALSKRIKKSNINNLIIIYANGKKVLAEYMQDNDITELYINFPDPWPKKRHKKRRLITVNFAQLVFSKLKNSGGVYLATDSESYVRDMLVSFEGIPGYKNMAGRLNFSKKIFPNITTKYEQKFLSREKKIYYLQYQVKK